MGLNSKFLLPSKTDFQKKKKIFELSKISQDSDSIIRRKRLRIVNSRQIIKLLILHTFHDDFTFKGDACC